MATAIDASTTIVANGASVSSTATTASFNAPAKSLILACVAANASTGGTTTVTITNNGTALTWTLVGIANFTTISGQGMAAIYGCYISSARSGLTVTATTAGSTSTTRRPSIRAIVVTGAHDTNWNASTGKGTSTTNNRTASFTQTVANSMLIVAASEWQKLGTPTSSDLTIATLNQAGADGVDGLFGYRQLDASLNSENYNMDAAGASAAAWNYVRLEVAPALVPTAGAGVDVNPHTINTEFTRTGTDSANGDSITARSWTINSGPSGSGSTIGTAAALSWTPTVAGTYVLRYSVTNGIGTTTDDMSITVAALAPTVDAGADAVTLKDEVFSRTATEDDGGDTITSREWTVLSGPNEVSDTIGTAAALNWTPTVTGTYVLQYEATNSVGSDTDTITVIVNGFGDGVKFIPELGTDGAVGIEMAWGADLTDLEGVGWTWTDVTTDVRQTDTLSIKLGRGDESQNAQPATLSLTFDNSSFRYSKGGISSNWPNVRTNTPCRVWVDVDDGNGPQIIFQGYATSFTPDWDSRAGTIPVVRFQATGVLRRLAQGTDPLRSSMFRYHSRIGIPTEYWPVEEDKTATQAASAVGGSPAPFTALLSGGILYGKSEWGGDTDNPATSRALKVSAGGALYAPIRSELFGTYYAISWSMRYTSISGARINVDTVLQDDVAKFAATYFTDGSVEVYEGASLTPVMTFNLGNNVLWDNVWHHHMIVVNNLAWSYYVDGVLKDTSTAVSQAAPELVKIFSLPDPGGTEDPVSIAHLAVYNAAPTIADIVDAATAYDGEVVTDRIERLCTEEDIAFDIVGTSTVEMGPQRPLTLTALLKECADADIGVIYDGETAGITYICRDERENAIVDLEMTADQLTAPFTPTDDDQRIRNRVTATTVSGIRGFAEDTDGPMGTDIIGIYDSSVTVNISDESNIGDYAGWFVHLGTMEGYRYPILTINMRAQSSLAPEVLQIVPSSRIRVTDLDGTLTGMSESSIDLLVEGIQHSISPFGWVVTLTCSPFGLWVVGTVADDTGDTDSDLLRLDTSGAELEANATQGATTISVTTTDGPLFSTTSDDYPMILDVGGVQVTATACADATSPQTITVEALPVARALGDPVKLWDPPVLGL